MGAAADDVLRGFEERVCGVGNPKKTKAGPTEKIFDRLTVLLVNQELLLNGTYGPVTAEQAKVLSDLVERSRELATLIRDVTDR